MGAAFASLVALTSMMLSQFLAGFVVSPFFQGVQVRDFTFGFFILVLVTNRALRLLRGARVLAT